MKKVFLFTGVIALVFSAGALLTSFSSQDLNNSIPEDVMKIFTNSCSKCHSAGGSGIAMTHVNFTKWGTYSTEKQAKKAADISAVLKVNGMPPKSFVAKNPGAVLTDAQKDLIYKWSGSFNAK